MRFIKGILLFLLGGSGYVLLEFLWRGWSHGTMFLAGGLCFLLVGRLGTLRPRLPLLPRALLGTVAITAVELLAGLLVNRDYGIWDYRELPGNFHGQICLLFSVFWMPVAVGAMALFCRLERLLDRILRIDAGKKFRYNKAIKSKEEHL